MKKKKSLPSCTNIEDLKTVTQIKKHIEKYPTERQAVWNNLSERLSDSYVKGLGKEDVLINLLAATSNSEEVIEDLRNTKYEANNKKITSFMHNYLLENRNFPNQNEIIENTKLSRQTIYNHLKGWY